MANAITPLIVLVKDSNGNPRANSREIAERFGKQHAHVLRAIDNIVCQDPEALSNFGEGYYRLRETGTQQHREFTMDRDGFSLLVMGFTGNEAAKWKRAYIKAFNAMEAALRDRGKAVQLTERQALRAALDGWDAEAARADAEAAARLLSDQRADAADAAKLLSDQRADHNKNVALKKMERLTQLEKTLGVVVDCGIGRPDEVFHGMTISDAARYFGVQQDWLFAFMDSGKDEVGGGVMPIGWISGKGHKVITKAYAKDGSRAGGAYMRMATIRLPKGYTKQPYLTIWGLDRLGELLAPIPMEVKNNPATLQLARDERRRLRTQKEIDKLSEAAKQGILPLGEDDEPR